MARPDAAGAGFFIDAAGNRSPFGTVRRDVPRADMTIYNAEGFGELARIDRTRIAAGEFDRPRVVAPVRPTVPVPADPWVAPQPAFNPPPIIPRPLAPATPTSFLPTSPSNGGTPVAFTPLPSSPMASPFDAGPLVGLGQAGCSAITNPVARALCMAAMTAAGHYTSKGDNRGASYGTTSLSCPPGYKTNAQGECVKEGVTGVLERALPGGGTGRLGGAYGGATMGAMGVPALVPAQLAVPTLRCPPGMILGRDSLCYMKGSIPRAWRKWAPAARPLMSAADGRVLTKARSLEKKLKKVAGAHIRKPCSCSRKAPARKK